MYDLNRHWGVAALHNGRGSRQHTWSLRPWRARFHTWQDLWLLRFRFDRTDAIVIRLGSGLDADFEMGMDAFLVSTAVVALAEMGDKTQLLAFLLAARFKKPVPIILGILVATILNHGLAGALGTWIAQAVSAEWLRWLLGLSFIGMALWTLIPDKIEEDETRLTRRWGVFGATLLTFFLAEMGDKTQVATVALAVNYAAPVMVVVGTTLGMLIADVPAVFVGDRFATRLPMRWIHGVAAAIFAGLGVLTLLGVGASIGV